MLHTHEVEGSSPPVSTKKKTTPKGCGFSFCGLGDSKIKYNSPVDCCLPPAGWRQLLYFLLLQEKMQTSPQSLFPARDTFLSVGESFGYWTHPVVDVDSNQTCSGGRLLADGWTAATQHTPPGIASGRGIVLLTRMNGGKMRVNCSFSCRYLCYFSFGIISHPAG